MQSARSLRLTASRLTRVLGFAALAGLTSQASHAIAQMVVTPAAPPAAAPAAAAEPAPVVAEAAPVAAATPIDAAPIDSSASVSVPPSDPPAWDLVHRAYNTWEGSTGGIFVLDPGMAEPGAIRMQLALDMYSGASFLFDGDHVEQDRQFISVSWTALRAFEVFGSLQNRATVADKPRQNSLHAFGDITLGFKVGGPVSPVLRVGGSGRVGLQNSVGEESSLLESTNFGVGFNAALDLQGLSDPLPLIARLNLDYLFDNSGRILDRTEAIRYHNLNNALDPDDETRHLVTRVERFGLGVNRVDMATASVGLEFPFKLAERMFLHPMVDFRFGMPVNRQSFDCAYHSNDDDRATTKPGSDDGCLNDGGAGAWPVTLAVGARFVPPIRSVSVLLGVDFALNGTSAMVREVAPTAPFRLMIALSYDYDARPAPAPIALHVAPLPPGVPAGRVLGRVTDLASGQPIAGVVVRFKGGERLPVTTDTEGRFQGDELPPGPVEVDLSHPEYEARACTAVIAPTGGSVAMACTLSALPSSGSLKLTVRDQFGLGISGARISLAGPSIDAGVTDAAGELVAIALMPGDYKVRIESDAHLVRVVRLSVGRRQQTRLEVTVLRKPLVPSVVRSGNVIRADKLRFEGASAELGPDGVQSVAELADLLLRDASVRRIRIQSDGSETLALTRALTIKQQLVDAGVPDARLEAVAQPGTAVTLTVVE